MDIRRQNMSYVIVGNENFFFCEKDKEKEKEREEDKVRNWARRIVENLKNQVISTKPYPTEIPIWRKNKSLKCEAVKCEFKV